MYLEQGFVIIGVDSSMRVIATEGSLVGQGVDAEDSVLMILNLCSPGLMCVCVYVLVQYYLWFQASVRGLGIKSLCDILLYISVFNLLSIMSVT